MTRLPPLSGVLIGVPIALGMWAVLLGIAWLLAR